MLDSFSWTSTSRLTLDANTSLGFHKPVTIAGEGGLTLTYNDGGSGGDLKFFGNGKINFWDTNSSLTIGGVAYTLETDIRTLAKDIAAEPSTAYALANDYDAAGDGPYSDSPVSTALGGTLNGLGHTIAHLSIQSNEETCIGLFATVLQSGTLRNISLRNVSVTGNGRVGTLAGCSDGSVTAAAAEGSVSAGAGTDQSSGDVGGLIGYADVDSVVASAQASVDVVAGDNNNVGGLIGRSWGAVVKSHASGNIVAGDKALAGGLVGDSSNNSGQAISDCYATGAVTSKQISGGLVGEASIIAGSYATGAVSGDFWVGGLVGGNARVENAYSLGHVSCTGQCYGGGLQGYQYNNAVGRNGLASSYSLGGVSAPGGSAAGGSVGRVEGHIDIQSAYWDITTSGEDQACGKGNCSRIIGYTDRHLKTGLPSGFDPKIWGQSPSINNGYPYLLANPPK